ncbi:MAG: NAD-dependent dehydratase [Mucilaginibacter sp.]|nr:NAD-dependent dehydratase [Mucilaginibacter sp.]
MKNVIILGASGNIAGHVTNILAGNADVKLTLFARNNRRIKNAVANCHIIEGDVLNYEQLKAAINGQDVVYANLSGNLEAMAQNIVKAMVSAGVKTLIFISSIGIYDVPLRAVLQPYRKAADVIEASILNYIILRPIWFTNVNEVDYEITHKGEPEKGSVISQKSLATFIAKIIEAPEKYARENLGINKPNS